MITNCFKCNKKISEFPSICCSIIHKKHAIVYSCETMLCHYTVHENIFRVYLYRSYNFEIGKLIFTCKGFVLPERLKSLLVFK